MDFKKLFIDNAYRSKVYVKGGNVEVGMTEVKLTPTRNSETGDYVEVEVLSCTSATLISRLVKG